MASDLMADFGITEIVRSGGENIKPFHYVTRRLNGAAFAGQIVGEKGETLGDVDLSVVGDLGFLGIIIKPIWPSLTYTLDTQIADEEYVLVLMPTGGSCVVAGIYNSLAVNVVKGDALMLSGEAEASSPAYGNGVLKLFVYANATAETDVLTEKVGISESIVTGDASDTKIVLMKY